MEDGRVWEFADLGQRRTQNLGGGIMETAPFHWGGDLADFPSLVHEVFESRMGSARPNHLQLAAFANWIERVPAVIPALSDGSAAERGRALFESAQTSCSSCHTGARLTNNQTVDVGTGGFFQVPSLVGVGSRAPFMHSGCAPTLRDRFGACGGGDMHGATSALSTGQIDDLVAYLESL
jgi:mono/diheme cytochrome c family protein